MKNKAFYLIPVLLVVLVAGFLFFRSKNNSSQVASEKDSSNPAAQVSDQTSNTDTTTQPDVTPTGTTSTKDNPDQSQAQYSGEGDIQSPDVAVFEVDFDGTAFTPKTTTIKNGDIVVFKNNSDTAFWPASNNHPTHTLYPEFDPKKAIPAGEKFEFKFIKTGTWGFHDHLSPSITGTIIVK